VKSLLIALALVASTALGQVPQYAVTLSAGDYDLLYSRDIFSDSLLPAVLTTNDSTWTGSGFRFKGTSTRFYAKKSFRVRVPTANLYHGQRDINFNAMYTDKSFLREYLAWNVFHAMGTLAPLGEPALLELNGRPQGLYLRIDKVDKYFLQRHGRVLAPMYQADDRFNAADLSEQPDSLLKLYYSKEVGSASDYADLAALIHALNAAPDASFADTLDRYFDMRSVLDWFAGNTVMMMGDSYDKNYYLYRDTSRATAQWTVIPWDYDLSFGRTGDLSLPYPASLLNDRFACTFPPLSGASSVLRDRFLATPALMERLRGRLDTVLQTAFTEERLHGLIDSMAAVVRPFVGLERSAWGTTADFEDHVAALKYYVTARRNYLLATFVHPPSGAYNDVTLPVAATGVPYRFIAYDGRQLATLRFTRMSGLDSVRVVAHPDSTPPSLAFPGDGRYVRRWIEVIPYPASASFAAELEWMYEDVAATSTELGSGVQDERILRSFVYDGGSRRALASTVNPFANTVVIDSVTDADCGPGRHFGLAVSQTYTQTWFRTPLVNWQRWHDVHFLDPWLGWIIGDQGTLLKTTDGGATWAEKAVGFNVTFSRLEVLSADTLVAAGDGGAIFRSADGGENWTRMSSGVTANLRALTFSSPTIGWCAGDGVLLRTLDGGASWTVAISDSAIAFQALAALGTDTLLLATMDDIWVSGSLNGGEVWISQAQGLRVPLRAFTTLDSTAAWAAGDSGRVFSYLSGSSWQPIPTPGAMTLRAVARLDNEDLYAAGDAGAIWFSDDNGATWHAQYSADSHDLYALCFTDSARGYAAGSGGTVLGTTSPGTVTGVRDDGTTAPAAFRLAQNYPNPFNPETRIEFQLPKEGPVSLVVYDLLGREVATLVDDVLQAGAHRVAWNASRFSSGVYFYRLHAGALTETRKLLLMR
jgi:spore coat protein CotH/photosystem II stability/assembly factor-like uncharacterized protein